MREQHQRAHASNFGRLCELVARTSIYLLAFLFPITFLPVTVDVLETNKQTLLLVLVSVSVIALIGTMIAERHLVWKHDLSVYLGKLFVVTAAVASLLSPASYMSWVGQASQEYTSFLSILGFVTLFIVGLYVLSDRTVRHRVWVLSFLSSGIIGFFALTSIIGMPLLPINFVGTPAALGFYLAAMSIAGSAFWLADGKGEFFAKGFLGIATKIAIAVTNLSALLVLISLDVFSLWVATLLSLSVMMLLAFLRAEEFTRIHRFLFPMVLFVAAMLFVVFPSATIGAFPAEIGLNQGASFAIARGAMNGHALLFGTGPGTYSVDYLQYVVSDVNQTALWDVRFDRAYSHILTLLPTFGLVGTGVFVILIAYLFVSAMRSFVRASDHQAWKEMFVVFAPWLVMTISFFVYPSNMTLSFLFWLFSALMASQAHTKAYTIPFATSPRAALATTFGFVLLSTGMVTVLFLSLSKYAAEVAFAKAVLEDQRGGDIDQVISHLDTATKFNKLSDIYYRNLGNAYLVKTSDVISDPGMNPDEVFSLVNASLRQGEEAVKRSPNHVVNWSMLGDMYREYAVFVENADQAAIDAYTRATELAPINPKYQTLLGQAYIVKADMTAKLLESEDEAVKAAAVAKRNEALQQAADALQKAVVLKSDYGPAHYYLALVYDRQGDVSEAVQRMEVLRQAHPRDIGVGLQLGLLYLKQGKNDLAQQELERVVGIDPTFANARWYLSAVYEQLGEFEKAVEQVEYVKTLNPDNSLVDQRLERLKQGKAEAEIPEPIEEGEGDAATDVEAPVDPVTTTE